MKQLSVFLENREGRLEEALRILKEEGINIISMSVADTAEYGMLRLIVNDVEKGKNALQKEGFSAHLSDVIAVKMPHVVGSLHDALSAVSKANINVEYLYALCTRTDEAAIVIKPSDTEGAVKALKDAGFGFFTDGDLF
ncbi:MAG: ACT domain-containing protein [Lachnospiraceae bacterium]|nr:ACT domain-containing protein [Lachnospiraceae bacterium]